MPIDDPLALLGGLTPSQFMKRHWQRKPLLVRGAIPGMQPLIERASLLSLAARDDVESRLVSHDDRGGWRMRPGPFARRSLPPMSRPGWTLLVQGMDLHDSAAHQLMQQFRFVPEARLDDIMVSHATDGGGVGPHVDSYDVFLLQAQGRRRWRIGRQRVMSLRADTPLKILSNFQPEAEYLLEPGDMLYLPPLYAHDGVAEGECQTWSVGFRAPGSGELARELLQRVADDAADEVGAAIYADPQQPATETPAAIPEAMREFARKAIEKAMRGPRALDRALGEYLTEPKAQVWFEARRAPRRLRAVALDPRTRMLYDERHVFINGESWNAAGRDATLMRRLADRRRLDGADIARASEAALELLAAWCEAGWLLETAEVMDQ